MREILRLSFSYLRYYKKQTFSLFLGILLSAALLAGIGSLLHSGTVRNQEKAREDYGDWHYYFLTDEAEADAILKERQGSGYEVERAGISIVRKVIEEPKKVEIVYASDEYMAMMGRRLLEGDYPKEAGEAAMDEYTLQNLGVKARIGSEVELDGETFRLCGILDGGVEGQESYMHVYVSRQVDYGKNGTFLYLKFRENRPVVRQISALERRFGIDIERIRRNNDLVFYVGGDSPGYVLNVVRDALSNKELGLPYLYAYYNDGGRLTNGLTLAALGVFAAFIIYSLFQISVLRRMSQYSVMQTLGMSERRTFAVLMMEVCMIFAAGYPLGCLLGNGAGILVYEKIGRIFVGVPGGGVHNVHLHGEAEAADIRVIGEIGKFRPDLKVVLGGAVFLLLFLALISAVLVRRMQKLSWIQMMGKDYGQKRSRKIYSLRHASLTDVLTKKFMYGRKGAFAGMILSLSVGGIIFLGATFTAQNTRINNELTFAADDGLRSDIQVFVDSDMLSDMIPQSMVEEIRKLPGIRSAAAMRYMLGEIPLYDNTLVWTSYFAETDPEDDQEPDPVMMEKYNGLATIEGDGDYRLKVNIYGYDDEMLEQLGEYLLEGAVDPEQMRRDNQIIFKTIMGGQGTYDGIDIQAGDVIQVKAPKDTGVPAEALRFQGEEAWYREQEFTVCALAARPLARTEQYIGDNGTDCVDLIMTREQMEQYFGVKGCHNIGIELEENADANTVSEAIRKCLAGVPKAMVKDYTAVIAAQNLYLDQKLFFFYLVAAILLVISLLHLVNSLRYLVAARSHEFGIMRAMGITDSGFCRMLLKEGLRYGIYADLLMLVIYFFVQKMLYYFMIRVYRYLQPDAWINVWPLVLMLALNAVICVLAVEWAGQEVLRENLITEINQ